MENPVEKDLQQELNLHRRGDPWSHHPELFLRPILQSVTR